MTVRDRLKQVRDALGETQKTIGGRIGLGTGTWQSLERDNRLPKTETLALLATLGFSIDWLLTGRGDMRIAPAAEQVAQAEQASEEEEIGPGEAILRALPQYPIPEDLQNSLDFIDRMLRLGPRNYPVARVNVLHLAELIDEILSRSELDKRSAPTKTSTS